MYITREFSCHVAPRDKLWGYIHEEITAFSALGNIMMTGDFNARTGVLIDYIAQGTMSYIPLPPDYTLDKFYPRLSQDEQVNNYGKELINLCIASKLRIVNGRLNSDGGFTCFTPRGNSEVDYIIAS